MRQTTKLVILCATLVLGQAATVLATGVSGALPVVAILAQNGGTETTDFLVPYGVLAESGVAKLITVSTHDGPVDLWPGLKIVTDTTIAAFDRTQPQGADFVIVPAFVDAQDATTRVWLREQSAKGATLVSICDGALALAGTGLLDGHRATGHFYTAPQRHKEFPRVNWVANTRFVHDGKFISSSGVSASLPTALYLVELIGGRERALAVAARHNLSDFNATHDSDRFQVGAGFYWIGAKNMLLGWPRDVYAIEVEPGIDEVGLGFAFDMLSRTYRSRVVATAATATITTRHGLRLLRDVAPDALPQRATKVRIGGAPSSDIVSIGEGGRAPIDVLKYLKTRYGQPLANFVAMQVEYPEATSAATTLAAH